MITCLPFHPWHAVCDRLILCDTASKAVAFAAKPNSEAAYLRSKTFSSHRSVSKSGKSPLGATRSL
jgi:hypothetical protein